MDSSKIISSKDMMKSFGGFSVNANSLGEEKNIFTIWKKVVLGIHSYKDESENNEKRMPIGERLAGNTRVIDLKNGVLLVETDHPGWIQYLRMYQKFILKGLKMNLPDLKISSLAFRVAGEKVSLSESYEHELEKSRRQQAEVLEKQEKELEKYNKSSPTRSSELPPELLAKFDSIRQSMLTNSDNK